jgi:hypothetical protein
MPSLYRNEKLGALHASRCGRRAGGGCVLIYDGRIDMAEAERDGALHHRLCLSAGHPERAEAKTRDIDSLGLDRLHDGIPFIGRAQRRSHGIA